MNLTAKIAARQRRASATSSQQGFSLLEVLISMVILTVGLVSLLGVFGLAISTTQTAKQDMIAKQLANQAIESIMTARDASQLTFSQIQNVSSGGIFMDGSQPINQPDSTGLIGTSGSSTAAYLTEPGKDGIIGTSDDVKVGLSNFRRTIAFTPLYDTNGNVLSTLRQATITITYSVPQRRGNKTYVLTSYVSQYH
ncbi:MAG: prepilin-type N-terminal cleavage/methylation domain-containing protein [Acidobacteria bacterium]|nr:prepilin-type N-terminal cleavage/methylation domain-containing protein [Acidobacteriota bacterium]